MKKIIIFTFLILNFFGSENLNDDFIEPTEENIKLFNSYLENHETIELRNFVKNSFSDWSKNYFSDIKNILKYGQEDELEDQNLYTKKKALIDLDFIKDKIEQNHGARLVLDKWFFDQLDELIEIAKNKILNSKNEEERLHIIDECIEPLEDKISKNKGGHFFIHIYKFYEKYEDNNLNDFNNLKNSYYSNFYKYNKIPYFKNNNLYLNIFDFYEDKKDENNLNNLKISIKKFFSKNFFTIKNIIFDLRFNEGGSIHLVNKILNIFFKTNNKYLNNFIIPIIKYNNFENTLKSEKSEYLKNLKIKNLNNNVNFLFFEEYTNNSKKYLSNNFIILMNDSTYSSSLHFINNLKNLIKDNNNNLFLIGDKTVKTANYGGNYLTYKLPSEIGMISIPLNALEDSLKKYYNEENVPNIYKNYNHLDNPDDLIDQVISDVELYKNGYNFSDKENAHKLKKDDFNQEIDDSGYVIPNKKYFPKLKKDDFNQEIDDSGYVIPNKKYFPKLEKTKFGYDIYKNVNGTINYKDYLF